MTLAPKTGYLKTLDGWRALAIVSVILYHDRLYNLGAVSTTWFHQHGQSGVDLFFAISGLLICWRLMEEEQRFGSISLKGFYIRRAFRILPPAFLCLAVIGALGIAGVFLISVREWLGAALFFRNYMKLLGPAQPDVFYTGHFWSLSVEEHFYFLLPALLIWTRRRNRLLVLGVVVLLVEAHRMQVMWSRPWSEIQFHTDVRLDALMIPAILAIVVQKAAVREAFRRWLRWWPVLVPAILAVITFGRDAFWETVAVVVMMPLLILGSVLNPENWLGVALEWAPLRFVGRISYSLYLWQQLFFDGHYAFGRYPLGILETTPLRFVMTFACAVGSYYLLERPMIKLGHRLAPPATPGR
jgi:peptidoglycan/LPS O-acetylase OafA/YrhL